jgi:hypothetical protein
MFDNISYCFSDKDSGFEAFSMMTDTPLQTTDLNKGSPPSEHDFYVRRIEQSMVIMGKSKDVANHVAKVLLPKHSIRCLQQGVDVDGLVKFLNKQHLKSVNDNKDDKSMFSMTYCHARVPAYGENLRSLSMYGDSLVEAGLFSNNIDNLDFYSCGLGRQFGGEIARIGNLGSISCNISKKNVLSEIILILEFIAENDFFVD